MEANNGSRLSRRHTSSPCFDSRTCFGLCKPRWFKMSWLHIVSAIVAAGLLIYLIAALLNPEDFS